MPYTVWVVRADVIYGLTDLLPVDTWKKSKASIFQKLKFLVERIIFFKIWDFPSERITHNPKNTEDPKLPQSLLFTFLPVCVESSQNTAPDSTDFLF